jgi:amidase
MKALSASEAVVAIDGGMLTSEKLVGAGLDRIAARDGTVKAWVHLDRELALKQARAADAAKGGVLRGVPIGVKDIIDTHDMPTGPTRRFEGRPPGDAARVALCRTANAVILGKMTTEFANRHAGPTTTPNVSHSPGGSSSGRRGGGRHVPLAFGTQTGGSRSGPPLIAAAGYRPSAISPASASRCSAIRSIRSA